MPLNSISAPGIKAREKTSRPKSASIKTKKLTAIKALCILYSSRAQLPIQVINTISVMLKTGKGLQVAQYIPKAKTSQFNKQLHFCIALYPNVAKMHHCCNYATS
jgi:hypothetical protein